MLVIKTEDVASSVTPHSFKAELGTRIDADYESCFGYSLITLI
jgi:hypothetical protein